MTTKTLKKKTLKKKARAKPAASRYATPIVESAREIWLAGLGAFSVAQHESGRMIEQGNKLFEKLVAEGKKLEKKTRSVAGTAVEDIRDEVESKVGAVRQQAADSWDKLETIFESRVARVLGRLGVPTAEDIEKLSERVQTLSARVQALSAGAAPKAVKPAAKAPKAAPRKPAAKAPKAAPKKPAARPVAKPAEAQPRAAG